MIEGFRQKIPKNDEVEDIVEKAAHARVLGFDNKELKPKEKLHKDEEQTLWHTSGISEKEIENEVKNAKNIQEYGRQEFIKKNTEEDLQKVRELKRKEGVIRVIEKQIGHLITERYELEEKLSLIQKNPTINFLEPNEIIDVIELSHIEQIRLKLYQKSDKLLQSWAIKKPSLATHFIMMKAQEATKRASATCKKIIEKLATKKHILEEEIEKNENDILGSEYEIRKKSIININPDMN